MKHRGNKTAEYQERPGLSATSRSHDHLRSPDYVIFPKVFSTAHVFLPSPINVASWVRALIARENRGGQGAKSADFCLDGLFNLHSE